MSALAEIRPELMLMELAADCSTDPMAFARGFWPETKPRKWQAEILTCTLKECLSGNPVTRVLIPPDCGKFRSRNRQIRLFIGMFMHWAMSTCAGCKVVVTAGTGTQLTTKTVPEVNSGFVPA